jgi:hypothetical protein
MRTRIGGEQNSILIFTRDHGRLGGSNPATKLTGHYARRKALVVAMLLALL